MFLSLIAMKIASTCRWRLCVANLTEVRSTYLWRVLLVYYADRHGHDDQDVQESCGKHPHPQHAVQLKTRSHWRHHKYPPPPTPILLLLFTLFWFYPFYFYSIPKFCSLFFSLTFTYLISKMTTTDDRNRDGNISNGTTHIMSSHRFCISVLFSLVREISNRHVVVTITMAIFRYFLTAVWTWKTLVLLFFIFLFKRPPWFSFEITRKTRVSSSAQLPAVPFMTASDKIKNETKWKTNCYHDFVNRWVIKFFLFFVFIVRPDAAEWECYWDAWPGCWATFSPLYFFVICW